MQSTDHARALRGLGISNCAWWVHFYLRNISKWYTVAQHLHVYQVCYLGITVKSEFFYFFLHWKSQTERNSDMKITFCNKNTLELKKNCVWKLLQFPLKGINVSLLTKISSSVNFMSALLCLSRTTSRARWCVRYSEQYRDVLATAVLDRGLGQRRQRPVPHGGSHARHVQWVVHSCGP